MHKSLNQWDRKLIARLTLCATPNGRFEADRREAGSPKPVVERLRFLAPKQPLAARYKLTPMFEKRWLFKAPAGRPPQHPLLCPENSRYSIQH